jgi:glutamine amidotransferase
MSVVAIPSLPCGNLASVARMVERVGGVARIVGSPGDLAGADRVIIAGVGAFDLGMSSIRDGGWEAALNDARQRGVPLLGICLGMQLLFDRSDEGHHPGLGWIPGEVVRFRIPPTSALKVPHMGWSPIRVARENPLVDMADPGQRFYFVHSYHAECREGSDVIATAHHGYDFAAAVSRGNVFGAQFHPEKSHRFGMALMKRFLEVPR